MRKWKCTECGACCKATPALTVLGFPVKDDGSCIKLVDNKCSIYEDRPQICRVRDDATDEELVAACTLVQQLYGDGHEIRPTL